MNSEYYRERINQLLSEHLPADESILAQAMQYATLQGGKRLRPLFVYATGLSFNASLKDLDYPAMAVEIIHAYSLIHDDLPSMDNDLLRRGLPTCHVVFGEAKAILTGDAMQAFAFELLAQCPHKNTLEMVLILAQACGPFGMAGGQAHDLEVVNKIITVQELEKIHLAKTGALIQAAILLGLLCTNKTISEAELKTWKNFGLTLGLAYQIQDDIFDVECKTDTRGKKQGADAALNKPTYPAILSLESAKKKLGELKQDIKKQLEILNLSDTLLAKLVKEVLIRTQ